MGHTVDLTLPDAQAFADYCGISNDLYLAQEWAQRLLNDLESIPPELTLRAPLEVAILTKYCRPFTTGVRRRLGVDELKAFTPAQLAKHEYLRACRDKHIAHSVNIFEATYARATFDDWKIKSVTCVGSAMAIRKEDLRDIIELSQILIGLVEAYIDRERKALVAKLAAMSPDEIRASGHVPGGWPVVERAIAVLKKRPAGP